MKSILEQQDLLKDKIYAGWMGKNIGGTLGAPLEGNMELLHVTGYTQEFTGPVENDDLDLQLVALHCIEQYGGCVTSTLLSQEWSSHVHFQYDEYGHALTNIRKGLTAPLSGCYNNFFTDCMGAPIRSELWAMTACGSPALAAYLAWQDACVDHAGGEGMYAEIFYAVLECLALSCDDLYQITRQALSYLPASCATRKCVELLLCELTKETSFVTIREHILEQFGTPNFTYAPPNIAFSLLGPFLGRDFKEQLLITACCGYDTDCTCATAASILGMMHGSSYLDKDFTEPLGEHIIVSRPITGIRQPATITELTDRTLAARELIGAAYSLEKIPEICYEKYTQQFLLPAGSHFYPDYSCKLLYSDDHPACSPDEEKKLYLKLKNELPHRAELAVRLLPPEGFVLLHCPKAEAILLEPGCEQDFFFSVLAPSKKAGFFQGQLFIDTYYQGLFWKTDQILFSLLPTWDWEITADGKTFPAHCPDNSVSLPKAESILLKTSLFVEKDCIRRIKVCVTCPVTMLIDGKQVLHHDGFTDAIPAYHRPTQKEWIGELTAGSHEIHLLLSQASEADILYFYAVTPEETYYAQDLHSTQLFP